MTTTSRQAEAVKPEAAQPANSLRPEISLPGAVLFACTHNMIRSPIAEGLMKSRFKSRVFVDSCGITAGTADGFVITVMAERGIDMQGHVPKSFDDLDDDFIDLIICFSEESYEIAKQRSRWAACRVEYWPVYDASLASGNRDARLDAYRRVRDTIDDLIRQHFPIAAETGDQQKP